MDRADCNGLKDYGVVDVDDIVIVDVGPGIPVQIF
jgi:hypothetical protein